MKTDDFNFELPEHLIAQHPPEKRGMSRLLHLVDNKIEDLVFNNVIDLLNVGDVLVLNDTRVIKARLYGEKSSGGKLEVLVERILNNSEVLAQIKASKSPKVGSLIRLADMFELEMLGREGEFFHLRLVDTQQNIYELLEQYGKLPLPPYITHPADQDDEQRYQTVFAREAGAVAAPTAGLHFDDHLLNQLKVKGIHIAYVTLHVGAGTFQPVRVDNIKEHTMHSERYMIPQQTVDLIQQARAQNKRVIAVGTTSLRALESASSVDGRIQAGAAETDIFITPGYKFRQVDALLTNFHLPKSTLMMLVSAFAGVENIRAVYQHAVKQQYRFFSYGDAMFLHRDIQDTK